MKNRQKEAVRLQLDRIHSSSGAALPPSLVGQAIGYACYGFAIYRLWRGDITYGSMTMLVGMAGSLRGSFSSVVNLVPSAIRACISAGRIMEVTGLPREESAESPNLRRILSQAQKQGVSVRMENVTAGYPGDKAIYTGADFLASPGEIIGLVGPLWTGQDYHSEAAAGPAAPTGGPGYRGFRRAIPGAGFRRHPQAVQLHPPGKYLVLRDHRGKPSAAVPGGF